MRAYTERQRAVLEAIRRSLEERGIAPTLEEIAEELGGTSRVTALAHLRALERKGAIRRRPRESRAIEVLDPAFAPTRGLPLLGAIAAGRPILEAQDPQSISLEEYLGAREDCFLLRVQGDSMIEDHIANGDLVLVESRPVARDGEMVVAVVDDEVTLKRYFREGSFVRLEPANARLSARRYPAARVRVRGVVRGVVRRL